MKNNKVELFSLNTSDICISSSLKCKGKHNYLCTKSVCGLNAKACSDYNDFIGIHLFESDHELINVMKSVQLCRINFLTLKKSNYCLKRSHCFKQNIWHFLGFQKVECNCSFNRKHSFKCGNDYCTLNSAYCDLLNINIKNEKNKFKKRETQFCQ